MKARSVREAMAEDRKLVYRERKRSEPREARVVCSSGAPGSWIIEFDDGARRVVHGTRLAAE